jgi:arylsulfatase A-like enzyme
MHKNSLSFILGFLALVCVAASAAPPPRPNILLIVADDMGFSDAGCYGGEIRTPNLDKLAANGLRFTQFYNTARCWPSRACILTGYYAQQVRRDTVPGVRSGAQGVRPDWARLLPEMLKPLDYRTYHSGKWHVDGPRLKGGFDRSYSLEDHNRYFAPRDHFEDDVRLPPVAEGSGYYATVAIADHAIKCLKEHATQYPSRPFFQYLCFIAPHFPLHAMPEDIAKYQGRYDEGWDIVHERRWKRQREMGLVNCALSARDPRTIPPWNLAEEQLKRRIGPGEAGYAVPWNGMSAEQKKFQAAKMAIHAAMVDRMDLEIGRVIDQLKTMGVFENTVIFFLSDNGASAEQIIRGDGHDPEAAPGSAKSFLCLGPGWSTAANSPFRLHKSWVHEGGISTPLIVHWPRGLAARGELRHNPGHLIDLAPTVLELAGGRWATAWEGRPIPPPPGKSLVPVFSKDGAVSHDCFWWFHETNRAVRVGDWKLVSVGKDRLWELYDLRTDRAEMNDLAKAQPARARELEQVWLKKMEEFRQLALKDLPKATNGPP